jgi:tetratricopeptide (TPR) repeat protein
MWAIIAALLLSPPQDAASDGAKALEEGRYEAAVQALTKAVTDDPKDYYSHFSLALAYGALRKDAEAVAEYRKTLELKPGLYEAELNAGMLLVRDKEPAEALPLLEDAASQKPGELRPRFYLAEALLETGVPERAEESFRAALAIDPKSPESNLGMAQALARQGKLAEAAPVFRRAIELDPSYRNALLELARLYDKNNQPAEAIAIYKEFPGNASASERLGQLLVESKQYAEGVSRLEAAYARDPSAANRILLAQAYILNGQREKALPLLEKSVAAEPGNFDIRMAYARELRDLRRFPEAAAQFQAAARVKPADARAWSELAAVLYMTGDAGNALAAIDRARELGEDTPGNWFFRAMILDKAKQLKPALEAYQKFLAASGGKFPDQEFQARQRARIIQKELDRR